MTEFAYSPNRTWDSLIRNPWTDQRFEELRAERIAMWHARHPNATAGAMAIAHTQIAQQARWDADAEWRALPD